MTNEEKQYLRNFAMSDQIKNSSLNIKRAVDCPKCGSEHVVFMFKKYNQGDMVGFTCNNKNDYCGHNYEVPYDLVIEHLKSFDK